MTASGAKSVTTQEVPQVWKKILGGALITIGVIAFFLAQSTVWVSNTFFNEDAFVGTVEQVLKTEDSRQALAGTIVHSALQNNPVAEQFVGKQATSIVTGLLGSDLVGQVFDRLAHRTYAYLTSSDRQDIAIDLTSIKDPLATIVKIVENNGRDVKFDPANIPDTITLIDSDSLPDISGYIRTIIIASGLLWFVTIAAFATYMIMNRHKVVRSIYIVGWSMVAVLLVALFAGPFIPPAIASLVNLIDIRSIVQNLSTAFLKPFQVQLLSSMVLIALVMLIVSLRGAIKTGALKLVALFK